jgi:hypothetical protein
VDTKKATSQARSVIGVRVKSDRAANLLYWVLGFIVPPNEQDRVVEGRATSGERLGVRLEDERPHRWLLRFELAAPVCSLLRCQRLPQAWLTMLRPEGVFANVASGASWRELKVESKNLSRRRPLR